jgi:hypothetical protein
MIESIMTISVGAIVLFAVAVLFVAAIVSVGPALLIFVGGLWMVIFRAIGVFLISAGALLLLAGLGYIGQFV